MGLWFEKYKAITPAFTLDQLCGCDYLKSLFKSCIPNELLDKHFRVSQTHAFLLYGAPGNGKRTLALAFAGNLTEMNYQFLHLPGIALAGASEDEACMNIDQLFKEIRSKGLQNHANGCYIFIEDILPICKYELAVWTLVQWIQQLEDDDFPCIITASAEDITSISKYLQKVMVPCAVLLPNDSERRTFLENVFEGRIPKSPDLKYKTMVAMTDGFNYDLLSKTSVLSGMFLKQKTLDLFGSTNEHLIKALEMQHVCMTHQMFENIIGQLKQTQTMTIASDINSTNHMPVQKSVQPTSEQRFSNSTSEIDYILNNVEQPKGFLESLAEMDEDDL